LTLKLQDSLDSYERYNENKHHAFFNSIISDIIIDLRKSSGRYLTDTSTVTA